MSKYYFSDGLFFGFITSWSLFFLGYSIYCIFDNDGLGLFYSLCGAGHVLCIFLFAIKIDEGLKNV